MRIFRNDRLLSAVLFFVSLLLFGGLLWLVISGGPGWLFLLVADVAFMFYSGIRLFLRHAAPKTAAAEKPAAKTEAAEEPDTAEENQEELSYLNLFLNHKLSPEENQFIYEDSGLAAYNSYAVLLVSPYLEDVYYASFGDLPQTESNRHFEIMRGFAEKLSLMLECTYRPVPSPLGLCVLLAWRSADADDMKERAEKIRYAAMRLNETHFADCDTRYAVAIGTPENEIPYIYYSYTRACGMLSRLFYQDNRENVIYSEDIDLYRDMICHRIVQLDRKYYATILSLDVVASMEIILQLVDIEYEELAYSNEVLVGFVKEKFNSLMRVIGFGERVTHGLNPDFWRRS